MDLFNNTPVDDIRNKMSSLMGAHWINALDINAVMSLYYILDSIQEYEKNNNQCFPKHEDCLRSLKLIKPEDVKVIILSKCPYPNANADGIPFSCAVDYSESLNQIHFGHSKDILLTTDSDRIEQYPMRLDNWVKQGVLLLNRKHRVSKDDPNSFDSSPWDDFIEHVLKIIIRKYNSNVIICTWGNACKSALARVKKDLKSDTINHMHCEHPVSASRNKRAWVCNHFDEINTQLKALGYNPIQWDK